VPWFPAELQAKPAATRPAVTLRILDVRNRLGYREVSEESDGRTDLTFCQRDAQ